MVCKKFLKMSLISFLSIVCVSINKIEASDNTSKQIDSLNKSVQEMNKNTTAITNELAQMEINSINTAIKTTKESLEALINNMYNLIAPMIATQALYKSADGQQYIIPTASIENRQKFDINSFKMKNEKKISENKPDERKETKM